MRLTGCLDGWMDGWMCDWSVGLAASGFGRIVVIGRYHLEGKC